MRKAWIIALFLVVSLLLPGCAQDTQPIAEITAAPTTRVPPEATPRLSDTVAAVPSLPPADHTPAAPTLPPPTPGRAGEATEPAAPIPTSLRPTYLRTIHFGIDAGNSYYPQAMDVDPGLDRLYARTHRLGIGAAGLVTAIDLTSGHVLAVAETGIDPYGEGGLAVDELRHRVYAVNPAQSGVAGQQLAGTCTVLDASTLETIALLDGVDLLALDSENNRLAVVASGKLRILDATGHGLLAELSIPDGREVLALAVDPASGRVALVQRRPGGVVLAVYDTATLDRVESTLLPGRVDFLLADPAQGRWLASGNDGQLNRLWIFGADLELLVDLPLGEWMQQSPLALDPSGSRLYVGRLTYPLYSIQVVDPDAGEVVEEIPLNLPPYSLAHDPASGRLLVSHTYDHRIAVIDVEAGVAVAAWPTAIRVDDVDLDPARGYLFATDSLGRLRVLEAASGETLAELPGAGRISVDSGHGRLYTGGLGASRLRIVDLDKLQITGEIPSSGIPVADAHAGGLYVVQQGIYLTSLETLTTTSVIPGTTPQYPGFVPNPSAIDAYVDPGTGRVFAIFTNGVPGSNGGTYLYVYQPVTYKPILQDTERSPWYLDIDPGTGQAYISRAHLAGVSTSLLEDGQSYAARVEGLYGALRVDPGLGLVYLTTSAQEQSQLWVLDAATLDVVDSLSLPGALELSALDADRHLFYLSDPDGNLQVWSATGGPPPEAFEHTPTDLADEAPVRLHLPPTGEPLFATDTDYRPMISEDDGLSWAFVGSGLPDAWVLDLAFSPNYPEEPTLWAGMAEGDRGYGVWISTDGGRRWKVSSQGLTDLQITALAVSPAYPRDPTLFATTRRKGLFRSTDGGATWQRLSDRYQPDGAYDEMAGALVLSPAFGKGCGHCDTIFVDHYGWQRSADGGETWQEVDVGTPGYGSGTLVFSPSFETDRRLVYFWVPVGAEVEVWVYVSADGGDTWQPAGQVPGVHGFAASSALVAPDGMVYLVWSPWSDDEPRQIYRSGDLFALAPSKEPNWQVLAAYLPAATPPELASDGSALLALDGDWHLARWPVDDLAWAPAAPQPTDVPPTATPGPTGMPTPSPLPTPTPTACALQPVRFAAVWEPRRDRLGCPQDVASEALLAEQPFERGRMLWDSESLLIFALQDPGGSKTAPWKAYADTWVEGVDPAWDPALPPPPVQPQRGFGKVWREQLGGPAAEIGWALEAERSVDGWRQPFAHALLFWTDAPAGSDASPGAVYLLYDDGSWESVSWPGP